MNERTKVQQSTAIPCLSYRDAAAAIDWLCEVFGFERQMVVPMGDGQIAHAQLRLGGGMIMLGAKHDNEFGKYIKQPDEIGGAETQTAYVVVSDADAVYARAKKGGAQMVIDIRDESYGGRGFTCRDPQGHIWSVGTYNPWGEESA